MRIDYWLGQIGLGFLGAVIALGLIPLYAAVWVHSLDPQHSQWLAGLIFVIGYAAIIYAGSLWERRRRRLHGRRPYVGLYGND